MRTSVRSSVDSASGNSSDDREFLGLGIIISKIDTLVKKCVKTTWIELKNNNNNSTRVILKN